MSEFQIITTPEELEALDPESLLVTIGGSIHTPRGIMDWMEFSGIDRLPAVVIATGDHVRAARKALEEEDV